MSRAASKLVNRLPLGAAHSLASWIDCMDWARMPFLNNDKRALFLALAGEWRRRYAGDLAELRRGQK